MKPLKNITKLLIHLFHIARELIQFKEDLGLWDASPADFGS